MIMVLEMLATIAVLALVSRRSQVPLPILLVIVGTILGFVPGLPEITMAPELVFFIFLPPLLYIQGVFTPWRDLKEHAEPIVLLAIGLVLVTQYSVAVVAHAIIPGISWPVAYVLGAIVSPTDAIAATSIARTMGVPQSIIKIVEGESLVNDASGIVIYRMAVVAVLTNSFSIHHLLGNFVFMSVGGIIIGLAVGWLMAKIRHRVNDTPVELTLSLISPFVVYLPAELLGTSGILAVVTAGIYMGWRAPYLMNSVTRVQWRANWTTISFLLNGMLFLLIGLQLNDILAALKNYSTENLIWYAFAISATTILTRLLWTMIGGYVRHFISSEEVRVVLPWKHRLLIGWSGMRGVVSLAAALALPLTLPGGQEFPHRDLLIFLTFCVIISTLVVQGLTLPLIIRWLKVEDDGNLERENIDARIKMARGAVARLEELATSGELRVDHEWIERYRDYYRARIIRYGSHVQGLPHEEHDNAATSQRELELELIQTERRVMLDLRKQGITSEEVLRRLEHELDLSEARLLELDALLEIDDHDHKSPV